jgi:hypothetical protein
MRTLGSFNKHVNLPSHPEDTRRVSRPQLPAPRFNQFAEDTRNMSAGGKFANSRGRMRFAGTAIGADIRNGEPVDQSGQGGQQFVASSGQQSRQEPASGVGAAERRVS